MKDGPLWYKREHSWMDQSIPHWESQASHSGRCHIRYHPSTQRSTTGYSLGTSTFSPFNNDLPDCVESGIRLFADDCILYRCIKKQKDCDTLQQDLNNLAAWEKKWGMAFHPEKCSAIRVTRAGKPISSSYTLKGHTLNMEDSTRYLGVELQSIMSWNRHMDQTVKKANSTLGFLWRNLRISNEQTKSSAYCSMVRPIIEYCSTVWSLNTKEYVSKVEMVQLRAARYVTNRYPNTSSVTSMPDHLDWESLEARCAKTQLTSSSKSSMDLLIYRQKITLYQLQPEHVPNTLWNFSRSQSPATIINSALSPELFVVGIPYQPMWLRLPVWYPSNGSY